MKQKQDKFHISAARLAMIIEIWFNEDNHETRIIKREELRKQVEVTILLI